MRNAGLEETQAGIKIAGRNINNLMYKVGGHKYWKGDGSKNQVHLKTSDLFYDIHELIGE